MCKKGNFSLIPPELFFLWKQSQTLRSSRSHVQERGYGAALKAGIASSQGKYIIMGDADDSYDFSEVPNFVEKLRQGYDLVTVERFKGGNA